MKKVFNKAEDVIHLFAQQSQYEARCSNVFFEGKKLYSYGYHYLLAEFIDHNTVLINDDGYSVTTSKHIAYAKFGLSQYKVFLTSQTDLDTVFNRFKNYLVPKLIKARRPKIYIYEMQNLWSNMNEYINYRKLKVKRSKEYKYIKGIINSIDSKDSLDALKDYSKKLEKKKLAKAKKLAKEKISKFKAYEIDSFRIEGQNDILRLSLDGTHVETSQNVKVSIDSAKKLYKLIKLNKDIKGYNIEGYTVISINGTLKVGCHNIDINSVHEIGKKL